MLSGWRCRGCCDGGRCGCGLPLGGCGLLGSSSSLPLPLSLRTLTLTLPAILVQISAIGELLLRVLQLLQSVECSFDHINRIRAAADLGHDILDTRKLYDRTHGCARDYAGARLRRLEHYDRADVLGENLVRYRASLTRDLDDVLASGGCALPHGIGNGVGLAHAYSHMAVHVANHNYGIKAQVPSALDHLGDPGNPDNPFGQGKFVFFAIRVPAPAPVSVSLHLLHYHLKHQSSLAGCVGQRLDTAMIFVAAPVEDNLADTFFFRALAD